MMSFLAVWYQEPAFLGLIAAIPALGGAYFAFRLSRKQDEAAKEVVAESGHLAWSVEVLKDNASLRTQVDTLSQSIENLEGRLTVVEEGSTNLRAENAELKRENIGLHEEIGELKAENETLKGRVKQLEEANGSRKEVP